MTLFKIAFRNILRNARRSLLTASAIAVGAIAMIVFGQYMGFVVKGFETGVIERDGHLSVFHKGYFDFGAGNPGAYSIAGYRSVIGLIKDDPVLRPLINVVTPTVTLYGIAGNFAIDASKTFLGVGVVPADRERMLQWDEFGINAEALNGRPHYHFPLKEGDPTDAVLGIGLARMLGLCKPLRIANCPSPPQTATTTIANAPPPDVNLAELAARDRPARTTARREPRIDLLAATANGAPNVISLNVSGARSQGFKELDDMYVGMDISAAQELLYGRGEHKAVSIVLQLYHTADVARTQARLLALFKAHGLDLEVHDFTELEPQYNQVIGLFGAIFVFIAVIMSVIVLFTVVNTMSMSVMERTGEIGTARAMGVRRSGIRRQFLLEGWMLGAIGATAGVVLAAVIAALFNRLGLTWTPPGQASPIPLLLLTSGMWGFEAAVWLALIAMATIAALIPANRAARMMIVDALRHV